MFKHYFSIAFRNLKKHPGYSLINLLGLSVGLAACLLIISFVRHELSYDEFHDNKDRVCMLATEYQFPEQQGTIAMTPTAAGPTYLRELPEVTQMTRVYSWSRRSPKVLKLGDRLFTESGFYFADSTFFDVFSVKLIKGNLARALADPLTVVITQSTAEKYFGEENPIGGLLNVEGDEAQYRVTAVIEPFPANSHFHFDFLASFNSLRASRSEIWGSANYHTYLLLAEGTDRTLLSDKMQGIINREVGSHLNEGEAIIPHLVPLLDIHLASEVNNLPSSPGETRYIYIFSAIALLILLIACINYMNLATARSLERAKEVSLKKVFGAYRTQIIAQFMSEAFLLTFAALAIAIFLAQLTMPYFSNMIQRELSLSYLAAPEMILWLLLGGLLVSFMAGGYPAMAFSTFLPAEVLKGSFKRSGKGIWVRKGLVVFQFAISVFLIISTMVVQQQLTFVQSKKLGYDKEQLMVLPMDWRMRPSLEAMRNEFTQHPAVSQISAVTEAPTSVRGTYSIASGWDENAPSKLTKAVATDRAFVETLGLQLIAGGDYTPSHEADTMNHFLLNESCLEMLGWTSEEAIGKPVNLNGRLGTVQGVLKDFHIRSLRESLEPLVVFIEPRQFNKLLVRFTSSQPQQVLTHLEEKWASLVPHRPFEYKFLDQEYDRLYQAETRVGQFFGTFALLTIFVACLGLFGLSAFTSLQRAKEISIRKVLGASVSQLVQLLSSSYLKLVGIAFLIAAPMGYWLMTRWLSDFTYHITVGWWIIVLAGIMSVLIALLTVAYQSIRAAMANPADWLKSE